MKYALLYPKQIRIWIGISFFWDTMRFASVYVCSLNSSLLLWQVSLKDVRYGKLLNLKNGLCCIWRTRFLSWSQATKTVADKWASNSLLTTREWRPLSKSFCLTNTVGMITQNFIGWTTVYISYKFLN